MTRSNAWPDGGAREAVRVGGCLAFLVGCDSMVVAPIAPEMLAGWHASEPVGSLLVAAYAVAYALTSPLFGALADRRGRRAVAVPGLLLFASGTALTAAAPSLALALACRAVAGLGAGMVMPMVFGEVSARSEPVDRGRRIGVVMGLLLASTVVGVPLGTLAAATVGWRCVFVALALVALLLGPPASRLFDGVGRSQDRAPVHRSVGRMLGAALTTPRLLWVLFATFCWNAGLAALFSSVGGFYRDACGVSTGALSAIILAAGVASVAGALMGGRLSTRVGTRRAFGVAAVLAASGVLVMVLAGRPVGTVAGHVLWSLAIGAGQPVLTTLAAGLEPRLQQTALSLNGSTQYLAQFAAASLGAAALGLRRTYVPLGAASALLALLAWCAVAAASSPPRATS